MINIWKIKNSKASIWLDKTNDFIMLCLPLLFFASLMWIYFSASTKGQIKPAHAKIISVTSGYVYKLTPKRENIAYKKLSGSTKYTTDKIAHYPLYLYANAYISKIKPNLASNKQPQAVCKYLFGYDSNTFFYIKPSSYPYLYQERYEISNDQYLNALQIDRIAYYRSNTLSASDNYNKLLDNFPVPKHVYFNLNKRNLLNNNIVSDHDRPTFKYAIALNQNSFKIKKVKVKFAPLIKKHQLYAYVTDIHDSLES